MPTRTRTEFEYSTKVNGKSDLYFTRTNGKEGSILFKDLTSGRFTTFIVSNSGLARLQAMDDVEFRRVAMLLINGLNKAHAEINGVIKPLPGGPKEGYSRKPKGKLAIWRKTDDREIAPGENPINFFLRTHTEMVIDAADLNEETDQIDEDKTKALKKGTAMAIRD